MRTEARFPAAKRAAGHYESFYIKATRPGGGQGIWIRHTVHKRPGAEPTASLWFTLFDGAGAPDPRATKVTFPAPELAAPTGAYIRIGEAVLEPGRAHGAATSEALAASWDLEFSSPHDSFRHLPYSWLYSAPLPRTKLLSPYPGATFTGRVTVGGEEIDVGGWPGMIGHNWGAEHAERWVWIHGTDFRGGEGFLDIAGGRIKLGPMTTPWIANGLLSLDGDEFRLGGLDRIRSTDIDERPTGAEFTLTGKGVTVRGRISSEPRNFVGWLYADPDGPEHNVLNCSIADLELAVEARGQAPRRIEAIGAAAYEVGMRETDHGIPLQPFPDGF